MLALWRGAGNEININLLKSLPIDWHETTDRLMAREPLPPGIPDCHGMSDVLICDLYAAGCPVVKNLKGKMYYPDLKGIGDQN
jgi:hypothetical protein